MPRDAGQAVRWLQKAADMGDAKAQAALAAHLVTGNGVAVDRAAATKWLRKAADQGNAAAQLSLAALLEQSAPSNPAEAYRWYAIAATRLAEADTEARSKANEGRERAAAALDASRLAEARKVVAAWKPK